MEAGLPDSFLVNHLKQLNEGSVLDLASGDGRHSLFLASAGFSVTAVDISPVALSRLDEFSRKQKLQIDTVQMDFDASQSDLKSASFGSSFDNLIIFFFKPPQPMWQVIPDLLRPGGKVMLCTFNIEQHQTHGFSRKFCLAPDELTHVHPLLEVELYHSFDDDERFLDGYIFKKVHGDN